MDNSAYDLDSQVPQHNIPRLTEKKLMAFKYTRDYEYLEEFEVQSFEKCVLPQLQFYTKHLFIYQ